MTWTIMVCSAVADTRRLAASCSARCYRQILHGKDDYPLLADLKKHLESIKWNLWHGNVPHALQRIDEVDDGLEMLEKNPANKPKMLKAVREFRGYIVAN